jgi:hypothetical protein
VKIHNQISKHFDKIHDHHKQAKENEKIKTAEAKAMEE